jgi:hypothetical protein
LKKIEVLWIGPVISESQFNNQAVSPAASIWQSLFIEQLQQLNFNFTILTHLPKRIFPFSEPIVFARKDIFQRDMSGVNFGFLNLPLIRAWYLKYAYYLNIKKIIANQKIDLIISYNLESYVTSAVFDNVKVNKTPWVSIVADMPSVNADQYYEASKASYANGHVYLSWDNFIQKRAESTAIFFEGGVPLLGNQHQIQKVPVFKVAYFGSLTKVGGIDLFLDSTSHLGSDSFEFHIVGNGDTTKVREFAAHDSRIQYHGAISQAELTALGKEMDLFIDPRPVSLSKNNFPSKVLTYLSFGAPIISTMGYGLSPEYSKVLLPLSDPTPKDLAQLIDSISLWDEDRILDYRKSIRSFVTESKSWPAQSARFTNWLFDSKIISRS